MTAVALRSCNSYAWLERDQTGAQSETTAFASEKFAASNCSRSHRANRVDGLGSQADLEISTDHQRSQRRPTPQDILLSVGDRIICVSAAVAEQMQSPHAASEKIAIVRNGMLGSVRRPPISQVSQGPLISRPAIVTLGGLHSCKGMQVLISAFAIAQRTIPNLALYILGKGPMRSLLEKQASLVKSRGGIHFVGFVADPRSYLSQADVFVLSSHREAFGLALAEAREAGCAVVGTNVGGIPEVLELGRRGILVSANKPTEMSDVIVDLLADETLRKTWQKRALENLSWLRVERVCEETLAVYNEALLASPNPKLSYRPS
jgi:glycosyltransferase involved in cell wall biosynthesis